MTNTWSGNSRISLYEKRKLIRQSIFFFVASLVILAVFFFFVLPITARLMDTITHGKPAAKQQTQQLRTPELQPLVSATNSAVLRVWGYVQDNANVTLFQNGNKLQMATPDASGLFSFDAVVLQKGDNQFYVQASSDKDIVSSPSQMYTVSYKTDAPKLEIQSPTEGLTVTNRKNQVISVSGNTDPQVNVLLNDRNLVVDSNGAFSGSYQLNTGDNVLNIRAIDPAGNVSAKELRVTYLP